MQFSVGIVSAFFADKIGRIKPFLFFFVALFCVACLCLTTLPNVTECNVKKASFACYNEKLHLTATSCQINLNNSQTVLCSKITVNNGKYPVNQTGIFKPVVTLFPKFDVDFKIDNINKISGVYLTTVDFSNSQFNSTTQCVSESCKLLEINCSAHFQDCNKNASFWISIYGILIVLYSVARTNVFRFTDIIVSDLTLEYDSDFGRQRVFAILGGMAGPPLVGIILTEINGSQSDEKSYSWAFFCPIIFSVLSVFSMAIVNPKFHKPASKMWNKCSMLIKNLDIMLFFALLITMGCVNGFQITYRNWYLKELGASDLLTGIVSGVSNLYGIPFLYKSTWFINKIGLRNVFVLGLLGHVAYSFCFSAMNEPWIALIIESTTILSYHLFWVSAVQYSDVVAPEGLIAIMKVLTGSLHFNIGKLGSSLIGGYVMNTYGGRRAFTVLGCIALSYSFVYASYLLIHHCRQRKIRNPLALGKETHQEDQN